MDDFQGHYPAQANEIMMSTWLLKRFEIEPVIGTEIIVRRLGGLRHGTGGDVLSVRFLHGHFLHQHSLQAAGLPVHRCTVPARSSGGNRWIFFHQRQRPKKHEPAHGTARPDGAAVGHRFVRVADVPAEYGSGPGSHPVFYGGRLFDHLQHQLHFRHQGCPVLWTAENHRDLPQAVEAGHLLSDGPGVAAGASRRPFAGLCRDPLDRPAAAGRPAGGLYQGRFSLDDPRCIGPVLLRDDFVSFAMTARKVLSISPMAALRYTEEGIKKKTSRSTDHAALPWMGLKNAFRHPAKASFVIGTFFLSNVTFLLCMTVLDGLSVEEYVNFNTAHDITLYNHMSRASFSPQEEQSFTPEIIAQLQQMEGVEAFGVTKVVPVYEKYSQEIYGDWYQIKSDFEKENGMEPTDPQIWIDSPSAAFWSLMVGVDSDVIDAYNQTAENPVDIDAFERGEFLLTTDMNGNGLHQGDMMTFFIMDTDQQLQLPIGGQIPLERDGMNGGAAPWLVVSNQVIDQYRPDAIIYSIKIDSDPAYEQSILDQVTSLTEHIPAISRTSKIELAESLAEAKSSLSKLSVFLTVVLFSIGILNFINTMSANVLNRQKEFASMEAVGATRRQVRQLIVWEGFWYFASTMALSLIVGSAADILLFSMIQNSLGFGAFHYPVAPFALYMLLALALCGAIPAAIYQKAGNGSIVQRLREKGYPR